MHHTQKHIAGLGILLLKILLDCFRERHVARLIALNDFRHSLVDYNDMIVFVNNFHKYFAYKRRRRKDAEIRSLRFCVPTSNKCSQKLHIHATVNLNNLS